MDRRRLRRADRGRDRLGPSLRRRGARLGAGSSRRIGASTWNRELSDPLAMTGSGGVPYASKGHQETVGGEVGRSAAYGSSPRRAGDVRVDQVRGPPGGGRRRGNPAPRAPGRSHRRGRRGRPGRARRKGANVQRFEPPGVEVWDGQGWAPVDAIVARRQPRGARLLSIEARGGIVVAAPDQLLPAADDALGSANRDPCG